MNKRKIYILLTRLPNFGSKFLTLVTGFYYTHASIGLDEDMNTFYSFVCDILSPLSLSLRSGSFSLNTTSVVSINELSPCVPRFLYLFIISYL
jgi:hypothetical protein